jgi:hypothetical protein
MSARIGFNRELNSHPVDAETCGFQFAWLEAWDGACLCRLEEIKQPWDNPGQWPAGRIFGPTGEYRWKTNGKGTIHAVMLMDEIDLPRCFADPPPVKLKKAESEQALILWGEWVNPDPANEGSNPQGGPLFYANEIPRIQTYPFEGDRNHFQEAAEHNKTPRLIVRRYRLKNEDSASATDIEQKEGRPTGEFMRCVGFDLRTEIKEK